MLTWRAWAGPAWEKGIWPGPVALLNSLLHNTMWWLAQKPIYTSAFIFSPQGYDDAKSSHFQLTTYLFAYFFKILVEPRNFSHGFQEQPDNSSCLRSACMLTLILNTKVDWPPNHPFQTHQLCPLLPPHWSLRHTQICSRFWDIQTPSFLSQSRPDIFLPQFHNLTIRKDK